jgi:predicted ATP-grasp superfamily ATP-dependent carboligase
MIIDYSSPLIQEYIKGDIYDVCILFNKGKYITSLTQKRVITNPPKGGSGLANVTVHYPELEKMSINLLKKIKWHGVAQVEYKLDDNDQPRLMEINPKFWGTLELSIAAGINFPKLLCDIAMYNEIPKNIDYEVNCKYLWLVPSLINYVSQSQLKMKAIKNILKFVDGKTKTNIKWNDPLPSIYQLLLMLKKGISLVTN